MHSDHNPPPGEAGTDLGQEGRPAFGFGLEGCNPAPGRAGGVLFLTCLDTA